MILYLHGFRSSPSSFKARLLAGRMAELGRADAFVCPQLPPSPRMASALAFELAGSAEGLTVIGSSLGGFYATWLAERLGCRAVLLNPAVHPRRELEKYVGQPLTQYHSDAPFEFRQEWCDELRELEVPAITRPERYWLFAATGDEVLDWREMVARYPGARHKIIEGSDHGISEFSDYLDAVLAWCGIEGARA